MENCFICFRFKAFREQFVGSIINNLTPLILIPARFGSSRFPGKPLAMIAGRPMIQWVYENAFKTGIESCVITDNKEIESCVQSFGGNVKLVEDQTDNGTQRIYLAYKRFFEERFPVETSLVINLQGDEPLMASKTIIDLVDFHKRKICNNNQDLSIATMIRSRHGDFDDWNNENIVKAIYTSSNNCCHYFSRAAIPYNLSKNNPDNFCWYQHIGIYSYQAASLEKFNMTKKVGDLEFLEKLEQLKALELGIHLFGLEAKKNQQFIGVDCPQDCVLVEKFIENSKK